MSEIKTPETVGKTHKRRFGDIETPTKNGHKLETTHNTPNGQKNTDPQKPNDSKTKIVVNDKVVMINDFAPTNDRFVDPLSFWFSLDTKNTSLKESLEKQEQIFIQELTFGQRLMTDDVHNEAKKEMLSKKIKIDTKIPQILQKLKIFDNPEALFHDLSPIVLDLKESGYSDMDKKIIIKTVLLQISFTCVVELLRGLTQLFLFNPGEFTDAIDWIHLAILTRIDEIIKNPRALSIMNGFTEKYVERLELRAQLLKLRGRTQLLLSQIKAKQRQEVEDRFAMKDKKTKDSIFDIPNQSSSEDDDDSSSSSSSSSPASSSSSESSD